MVPKHDQEAENNTNEDNGKQRFFEQVFNLWVLPEVERRQADGLIPKPYSLLRAQVLFSLSGKPIVRLNDEVKVIVQARAHDAVKKGQELRESDLKEVTGFRLEEEESDFGHITIIQFKGRWIAGFSFQYNTAQSEELLKIGQEFLTSARTDLAAHRCRPAMESAFVAAENIVKARVYLYPDREIRAKRMKHTVIGKKVGHYAGEGSLLNPTFKQTYDFLLRMRDQARYDSGFKCSEEKVQEILRELSDLSNEVSRIIQMGRTWRNAPNVTPPSEK